MSAKDSTTQPLQQIIQFEKEEIWKPVFAGKEFTKFLILAELSAFVLVLRVIPEHGQEEY